MSLHIYRSHRMEWLVETLAARIEQDRCSPFDPLEVVVGSRGMERWLRYWLAQRSGVCAQVRFPFPRQAIDERVLDSGHLLMADVPPSESLNRWLTPRVIKALRATLADPSLSRSAGGVLRYLGRSQGAYDGPVIDREWTLAEQIADTLERLTRRRPDEAMSSVKAASTSQDPPWLGAILRGLLQGRDPHQARLRRWNAAPTENVAARRPLYLFGLSSLHADDVYELAYLARQPGREVHLFQLAVTAMSIADDATTQQLRVALADLVRRGEAQASSWTEHEEAVSRLNTMQSPLLAQFGAHAAASERITTAVTEAFSVETHEQDHFDLPEGRPNDVLHALQSSLVQALPIEPRLALAPDDRSVTFHPCYGPTRQVELLRDLLEHTFAATAEGGHLQPRHVLVMTPDIQTYGPLVAAVFGRSPKIPVQLNDLALRDSNPFAEVLMSALQIAQGRLTLSAITALLQLRPVWKRFDFDEDQAATMTRWLEEAGARWGFDAEDRQAQGQPKSHLHSFDFALQRLVMGFAALDEPERLDAEAGQWGTDGYAIVPMDKLQLEDAPTLTALVLCMRALKRAVRSLRGGPGSASAWRQRLVDALVELAAPTDTAGGLWTRTLDAIEESLPAEEATDPPLMLPLETVTLCLQGQFEIPRQSDRPIGGGVTVCSMEPMRSVPFEVIALLGMDDQSFPRSDRPPAWSPFAGVRRHGEHSKRELDQHLVLESILSARRRLMVLWTGHCPLSGEELPAAAPVDVLRDVVDASFEVSDDREDDEPQSPSQALTFAGTLQPWSARNFQVERQAYRGGAPMSFGPLVAAAESDAAEAAEVPGAGDLGPPSRPSQLSSQELAKDLMNGPKLILSRRGRVRQPYTGDSIPDREPQLISGRDRRKLAGALLKELRLGDAADLSSIDRLRHDPRLEELQRRWEAQGALPHGSAGQKVWNETLHTCAQLFTNLRNAFAGTTTVGQNSTSSVLWLARGERDSPLSLQGGDARRCRVEAAGRDLGCVLWDTAAGDHGSEAELKAWVDLLLCVVDTRQRQELNRWAGAVVASPSHVLLLRAPEPADAQAFLNELVDTWIRAYDTVTPLFPGTSPALVRALHDLGPLKTPPQEPLAEFTERWRSADNRARATVQDVARTAFSEGSSHQFTDHQRAEVAQLFAPEAWARALPLDGPADPDGWMSLAIKVWGPLQAHREKVTSAKAMNAVELRWGARS